MALLPLARRSAGELMGLDFAQAVLVALLEGQQVEALRPRQSAILPFLLISSEPGFPKKHTTHDERLSIASIAHPL